MVILPSMTTIERLSKYIEQSGLRQGEFGKLVGLSQPTLSNILAGRKGVGLKTAAAIERETGIPASAWAK